MKNLLTLICLAVFLTSCGVANILGPSPNRVHLKTEPLEYTHQIAVRQDVSVGEYITASTGIPYAHFINVQGTYMVEIDLYGEKIYKQLPKGRYERIASDSFGDFYAYVGRTVFKKHSGRQLDGVIGVYIPDDTSGKKDVLWSANYQVGENIRNNGSLYLERVGFDVAEELRPSIARVRSELTVGSGFVSTITYLGVASNQLRFSYREFNNQVARAAFTQEFAMDYKPGGTYSFKEASWVVHEADNQKIDFTLISHM